MTNEMFNMLLNYKGRLNRKIFIYFYLFNIFMFSLLLEISNSIASNVDELAGFILFRAILVAMAACNILLIIQRLNDLNKNKKILALLGLLLLIPAVGFYYLGQQTIVLALFILLAIYSVYIFILTFFIKGTVGENKYGKDSLEEHNQKDFKFSTLFMCIVVFIVAQFVVTDNKKGFVNADKSLKIENVLDEETKI